MAHGDQNARAARPVTDPGGQAAFIIRQATRADLDRIVELERLAFSSPWSRQVFVDEFDQEFSRILVVEAPGSGPLLGFIDFWLVHDELHVLNVATHPDWRRHGLARRLLGRAFDEGKHVAVRLATLEVRRSNVAAIGLYGQLGFQRVGVRPRYYQDGEDALVMVLDFD